MVNDTEREEPKVPSSGKRTLRFTAMLSIILGGILTILLMMLAARLDFSWESSVDHVQQVSERTRGILSNTQGAIRITCFFDRGHLLFRPISRLLRGLQQASRAVAGADLEIDYVDPRWDLARAGKLAALKIPENSLVFEQKHRTVTVTLDEMLSARSHLRRDDSETEFGRSELGVFRGETICASAIARLGLPFEKSVIYWLDGHGEVKYDNYDERYGFSDIARELTRDGFEIRPLQLPGLKAIPTDCHILIVAGPRKPLAREEFELLQIYLLRGGRMLCLLSPATPPDFAKFFANWGIRVSPLVAVGPRTLTGGDIAISNFGDHVISRNLENAAVIFGTPRCLDAAALDDNSPDKPTVSILASSSADGWGESQPDIRPYTFDPANDKPGPVSVAIAVERGEKMSHDIVFKPTRLCVIGETDFVMNGALATRANANRDFFLNAVTWLAGIDTSTAPSQGGDATLVTGMTRKQWILLKLIAAAGIPAAILFLFFLGAIKRNF